MANLLRTVTPFRALPVEIQRSFKTRFPGVDGLYFNKIYGYYGHNGSAGDYPHDVGAAVQRFACRLKISDNMERVTAATELATTMFAAAAKGIVKLTETNEIIAESAGLMTVEQLRSHFWYLNITEWGKKHLSINVYGGCDFEQKKHADWSYKSWENVPYAKLYKPEDVQAAADRLMAKLVADAEKRLAEMKALASNIKEA